MAKKMKMRRTRGGIVFVDKVSLSQRMVGIGFMPVAMTTLVLSFGLLAAAIVLAVVHKGEAPVWVGALPMASLVLSGFGAMISWYAHYHADADGKHPWTLGFLPNGAIAVILVIMYFSGIFM